MGAVRGCFARIEPWVQARQYVRAVSSDLPERNGWTIAEWIGDRSPDKTQRLLNHAVWDTGGVMAHVRRYAVAGLERAAETCGRSGLLRVGALDETGQEKKGRATAGVKRQHMGCAGGVDNGINTVHLAYVRQQVGHALIGCRQWIPAEQVADPGTAARMGLPDGLGLATKGQLAVQVLQDTADDGVVLDFVAGDEVYGHSPDLRTHCEASGQAYVLRVRSTFTLQLGAGKPMTCKQIVRSMLWPKKRWQICSAGSGDKGARDYAWAWVATASAVHWLLVRKHLRTGELAFHYCHVPAGRPVSLHLLVTAAGLRWPVEESFEFGKDLFGLDQSQVRRYEAIRRHTVLVMLALAVFAVAAASARPRTDTQAPPPTGPDTPPPAEPGHTPLTVAALKNLVNALHPRRHGIDHTIHWQNWRDRHRARARWHHQRTRLRRPLEHAYPQLT
ncbi:IS701 family transposase [Actinomadura sp. LD22]|uniref:IS701 family transposase n=2 Tax=Actinomadura physcomitrii TaxID=2650748 RepID=A0A6I4MP87_9ACTN|nr:IS701 family transposase [Actinomadura physcomitrii]